MGKLLALATVQVSFSYAGTFHTIIGPDGRPMVVQIQEKSPKKVQLKEKIPFSQKSDSSVGEIKVKPQPSVQAKNLEKNLKSKHVTQQVFQSTITTSRQPQLNQAPLVEKAVSVQPKVINIPVDVKDTIERQSKNTRSEQFQQPEEMTQVQPLKIEEKTLSTNKIAIADVKSKTPPLEQQAATASQTVQGFSTIEGEKYVNNEYLEDKEFNLEGKKRFYTLPEGVIDNKVGQTRMQTIEREKGVSRSVIDRLFQRDQPIDHGPITLATSYYRVSKTDAVQGLGQQCFVNKKIKKAKELDLQQDINLWPRAPLVDEFDYEVVKLKSPLQNIRINSFASKIQNPTFYWPFVVFLDQKGCVIEGAGGFKNNDGQADAFYHEKIEGIIQVPRESQYLLLTPLASAIDVDGRVLSNQGQLKLTAIR